MKSVRFTALVLSLPAKDKTVRMRIWRALRSMGCGVLRDGVYLLPEGVPQAARFIALEAEVGAAGGNAMTVEIDFKTSGQYERVRKLFDRTSEYTGLLRDVSAARRASGRVDAARARLRVLRRRFDEIVASDFFPGQANLQAEQALADLERDVAAKAAPGEPRRNSGGVRRVDAAKYRRRVWATRKSPWVDRLASAWLIRRFIDPQATVVWIDGPGSRPRGAVGFDFDGAEFTHVGNRVTFEVLLAAFGLEADAALTRVAAAVHCLDVGGVPVPEVEGIRALLEGARAHAGTDDGLALEAHRLFDFLYAAFRRTENPQ
jgi:hypothetical protein